MLYSSVQSRFKGAQGGGGSKVKALGFQTEGSRYSGLDDDIVDSQVLARPNMSCPVRTIAMQHFRVVQHCAQRQQSAPDSNLKPTP